MAELPVVCTLTPETLAARKTELLPALMRRVEHREVTSDGVRLRFAADALREIVDVIEAERRCCRFLRFEILVEPDEGPIWLSLSGPPGTREFLSTLIETVRA